MPATTKKINRVAPFEADPPLELHLFKIAVAFKTIVLI